MLFSQGHAHCHAHSRAQRACGRFHADGVAVLGMSRRQRAQLAEIHDILFGEPVSEQV